MVEDSQFMNNIKVSLDSRLIKPGEYFVPVKGDTFDGHQFIDKALANGAVGIIEESELYDIAKDKLKTKKPKVIGIAGAVGKTTFCSYLTQILSHKFKVLEGSLNTKLGLATIIVNDLLDQEIIVAELGIDRIGEMDTTSKFIEPDFCVITKFEKEHLQFLNDLDTAVNENLFCVRNSEQKLGYINIADKKLVKDKLTGLKIKYFPSKNDSIQPLLDDMDFPPHDIDYLNCIYKIVTTHFNFSLEDFKIAISKLKRPKGRLNLLKGKNNSLILDDSYNAVCDTSITHGIKFAQKLCKKYNKKLTIVISPIRETGNTKDQQHKSVADFINSIKYEKLILVDDDGSFYIPHLKVQYEIAETSTGLELNPTAKDLFYVKGSQFYRMEKCVEKLMKDPAKAKDLLVRQDARWE